MVTFSTGDGHADEFSNHEIAPRWSDRLLATQGALNALAAEAIPTRERKRVLQRAERLATLGISSDLDLDLADGLGVGVCDALREVVRTVPRRFERSLPWMLFYRLFLLGLAVLVVAVFSLFVSPVFEKMFNDFGMTLPWLTQWMLGLGRWVRYGLSFGPLLTLILPVVLVLIRFGTPRVRRRLNRVGLRSRGTAANLNAMANLARGTAERLDAGAPLTDALRESAASCGDPHFQMLGEDLAGSLVAEKVAGNPNPTSYRIGSTSLARRFPANFLLAISGQEAAMEGTTSRRPSSELLLTLADLYEERASERVESVGVIWGICEVLFLGLFVICVAAAFFLPLVNLIDGLSQ